MNKYCKLIEDTDKRIETAQKYGCHETALEVHLHVLYEHWGVNNVEFTTIHFGIVMSSDDRTCLCKTELHFLVCK